MLAWWLLAQHLVGRLAGRSAAWLMAASPVVCGALVRTHFDAVPVAVVLGALVALVRGRDAAAFVLLAVGGLIKLFPLVLAPVAALWLGDRRRAGNGVVLCAAVTLAGIAPFVALGGFAELARFHLDRPVQLESTPATVVFALSDPVVTNTADHPDRFKSNGVESPVADIVQPLFTLLQLVVLAGIAVAAGRRPREPDHLLRCAFAAVLAFVALGKVLSPQYALWLYPFAAIAWTRGARPDRVAAAATFAAIALTQLWFPSRYFDLVAEDPVLVTLCAARNALFVTALCAMGASLARSPQRVGAAVRTSPARP